MVIFGGGDGSSLPFADTWEYGVFGCTPCDADCDGTINLFDIQPFVALLAQPNPSGCSSCAGDTNDDGSVNAFDIGAFVACLSR